jgi:hypothetical protein
VIPLAPLGDALQGVRMLLSACTRSGRVEALLRAWVNALERRLQEVRTARTELAGLEIAGEALRD